MSSLDAFRHRLAVRLRPRHYAAELETERQFHLDLEAMQQQQAGMGPKAAGGAGGGAGGDLYVSDDAGGSIYAVRWNGSPASEH